MGAAGEDRLSADELMAQFVVLLFAGSDTTNALMANGMLALLQRPDQWSQLCRRPRAWPATRRGADAVGLPRAVPVAGDRRTR